MNARLRPSLDDILRAEAAERAFQRPAAVTNADVQELRSYASALASIVAKADRLAPALAGHAWRVRGAVADLAKLNREAWARLAQMERQR